VLSLMNVTALTFATGNGTRDAAMRWNGSVAAVNAALSNISYEPNAEWNGHDSVVLSVTDLDTAPRSHELYVAVRAINDAPTVTAQITSFAALDSVPISLRGLSVADGDFAEAFHGLCQLNVSALNGSVHLGAKESANQRANSGEVVLVSDVRNINEALLHLMYVSTPRFEGVDAVTLTFDDNGNYGVGGALSDSESVNVTVSAVNHPPTLSVSTALLQMAEDGVANFSIVIADEDCVAIDCNLTLTLRSSMGSLMPSQCPLLTSNAWAQTVVVNGNVSRINECAADVTFAISAHWNGILGHEIRVALDDNGHVGAGDAFYVTDVIGVNVSSVNDALSVFNTELSSSYSQEGLFGAIARTADRGH